MLKIRKIDNEFRMTMGHTDELRYPRRLFFLSILWQSIARLGRVSPGVVRGTRVTILTGRDALRS